MKNDDNIFTEYVLLYNDGEDLYHYRLTSILKFIRNHKIEKYILKGFKNNEWTVIRDRS